MKLEFPQQIFEIHTQISIFMNDRHDEALLNFANALKNNLN